MDEQWEIILMPEVEEWYLDLCNHEPDIANRILRAIDILAEKGPTLGRPWVDKLAGSRHHNLKELRPTRGGSHTRILFVFDPTRQAILLVAGDKAGNWKRWYDVNIPIAEQRYDNWLNAQHGKGQGR